MNHAFQAILDDYALLGSTLIDYFTLDWNEDYYDLCNRICADLINYFEDKDKGGYFFTSNKHEKLFHRPKSISDDSIPSGLVYALIPSYVWDILQVKRNIFNLLIAL